MENTKFTTTELKVLKALVGREIENCHSDLKHEHIMPTLAAMLKTQLSGLENLLEKLNATANAL
jgi:hypothetical protein